MKVKTLYFSPTGGTEKIALAVADAMGEAEKIDVTLPEAREREQCFSSGDTVVVAMPVYAGRVPNLILPYLKEKLRGNGANAVAVVVYGNRNYDDALMELTHVLTDNGFHVAAGGAFVAEHSFSKILGAGRPDEKDLAVAAGLGRSAKSKLENYDGECVRVGGEYPLRPYYTPRDRKGTPVNILKVKPKTSGKCTKCGLCAGSCPMGSISSEDPTVVTGVCIKCGACEKKCPVGAKYYDDAGYIYHRTELELGYTRRAEPELFL